jgi:hypothetical protein
MREPPQPGNKEIQDLIWGAYKQVQRLRSQWPPAETRETPAALTGTEQTTAQTRLLQGIQDRLASVQRDLQGLQRELAAQQEQEAADAQSRRGKLTGPHVNSTAELFEAVRLGIVEIAEARQLLGLPAGADDGSTTEGAAAGHDQTLRAESSEPTSE